MENIYFDLLVMEMTINGNLRVIEEIGEHIVT